MSERLGPRACAVCRDLYGPEHIEGCWRCQSKLGHRHLDVVDRHGRTVCRVAACGSHAPDGGPSTVAVPSGAPARPGRLSDDVKRRRDRERRKAQRIVLDRHADEVAQVLAEVRR